VVHTHPQDESYIVLEGVLTIQAGKDRFVLEPGGVAAVPMGVPHTFCVESDTAHVLVLSTPAGLERMVQDASVPAATRLLPPDGTPRPSAEQLERIFRAHGQVTLGPPLRVRPANDEPAGEDEPPQTSATTEKPGRFE
jgi:hypothetical protein